MNKKYKGKNINLGKFTHIEGEERKNQARSLIERVQKEKGSNVTFNVIKRKLEEAKIREIQTSVSKSLSCDGSTIKAHAGLKNLGTNDAVNLISNRDKKADVQSSSKVNKALSFDLGKDKDVIGQFDKKNQWTRNSDDLKQRNNDDGASHQGGGSFINTCKEVNEKKFSQKIDKNKKRRLETYGKQHYIIPQTNISQSKAANENTRSTPKNCTELKKHKTDHQRKVSFFGKIDRKQPSRNTQHIYQ